MGHIAWIIYYTYEIHDQIELETQINDKEETRPRVMAVRRHHHIRVTMETNVNNNIKCNRIKNEFILSEIYQKIHHLLTINTVLLFPLINVHALSLINLHHLLLTVFFKT